MGLYTNTGLVKHAKMALGLKTVYMNSMILREITPAYYKQVIDFVEGYGASASSTGYTAERKRWLESNIVGKGYYGVDCVCLVKSYYWSGKADGGVGSPKYTASNDLNAGAMYQRATVKGPISTMPDTPGLILFSKTHPHVGIYIGNGETIESTLGSRGDGVVKRKLDSFWEYWFECPFIDYPETSAKPETSAPADSGTESRTLAYPAIVRSKASPASAQLGRLTAGSSVDVVTGTETDYKGVDGKTYTYIKVRYNGKDGWIVKSALK